MGKFSLLIFLLGLFVLFTVSCDKKEEPLISEEQLEPEDDIVMDEVDLESVEDEDLEEEDLAVNTESTPKKERVSFKKGWDSHSSKKVSFARNGKYVVQVSVFKSERQANRFKDKLVDLGYPAYLSEVMDPVSHLSGTYYRVRIGSFNGISEAKYFGEKILHSKGYDFWIDLKSNDNFAVETTSEAPPVYEPPPPIVEKEDSPIEEINEPIEEVKPYATNPSSNNDASSEDEQWETETPPASSSLLKKEDLTEKDEWETETQASPSNLKNGAQADDNDLQTNDPTVANPNTTPLNSNDSWNSDSTQQPAGGADDWGSEDDTWESTE